MSVRSMYPDASLGLMPFVKPAHKRQAAKVSKKAKKAELMRAKAGDMKTYKVTLRDRNGFTYTYIIQADPSSKSNPVLCASMVAAPATLGGNANAGQKHFASSLPVMSPVNLDTPEGRNYSSCLAVAAPQEDLTKVGDGEKKGILDSIKGFLKKLKNKSNPSSPTSSVSSSLSSSSSTSSLSSKSGRTSSLAGPGLKSKRKPKHNAPKKRLRKISAKSNLDPIQESPEEDESDSDSYTHDSASDGSLTES